MSAEASSQTLLQTIKPFRLRIGFTYGVMLMETVFEVLYPFTLGIAINGLLAGDGFAAVLPFGIMWLAHICSATFRQMYDTRLFTRIYSLVAGNLIVRQHSQGASTSTIAARSAMAREAIDFFEFEIPTVVTALVTLFGGVLMLFVYDVLAGAVMTALLVPIFILYQRYGKKSLKLSRRLNNRLEREVTIINDATPRRVTAHFTALARWRVWLSDTQARTWALADFFMFAAVLFVLFRLTAEPDVQPGDVFAGLAYALDILVALDQGPVLIEQFSRILDIRRRVDDELAG